MKLVKHMFTTACLLVCSVINAAPLDAFLEATPQNRYGDALLEVATEAMNKQLDIFKLRNTDAGLPDNAGDYRGSHLRAGVNFRQDFWLEAGLKRRKIEYSTYHPQIDSWQIAGQWQLIQGSRGDADVGLRVSAWGNSASNITRNQSEAVSVGNQQIQIQALSISKVQDHQAQLDLISTWRLPDATVSVFAGGGQGRVSAGDISVQSSLGNFSYSAMAPLIQALSPSYKQQIDGLNYRTHFLHAGFNLSHQLGDWRLRGGYDLFAIRRTGVDELIANLAAPNNKTYRVNHTLVGEIGYRLSPNAMLFTRGQIMSNQFLSEAPMLYNTITAKRFNEKYGIATVGLAMSF